MIRWILLTLFISVPILASESSTYDFSWLDPDKEVYVLQNRKFRKKKSLFLGLGYGKSVSGAFVSSRQLQFRAGYYFREDWGATVLFSSNSGKENGDAQAVRSAAAQPFRRVIQDYSGFMLMWAPFYSKLNTFNKVIYYDLIFGLGYGKMNEENNRLEVNSNGINKEVTKEDHSIVLLDIGTKVFLSKHFSADLNLTGQFYKAVKGNKNTTDEGLFSHYDLTLGIGYTF